MLAITKATKDDVPAIAELLEEMDRFYGVTEFEPLDARMAQIRAIVFTDPPAAHLLLAHDDDRAAGLATYSFLWPAVGLTRSLYLKELYVADAYRRRGVGRLLMDRVRGIADETGCSRVEWTTDRDNEGARRFYKGLGYAIHPGKVFYRLESVASASAE